jgi:ATP-dependent Clp protease protease subunit
MYTPRVMTRLYRQISMENQEINSMQANTLNKRKRSDNGGVILPGLSKINKGNDDDDDDGNSPFKFPKLFNHHDYDVYTERNHIFFKTDVNEASIDKLSVEIDTLNNKLKNMVNKDQFGTFTPKPIYLHITTRGGDLLAGFFAFDKIRNSNVPIHTIIEGSVASAGSIMSIAGKRRYITKNSHVLIHQLRTGMFGTYEDLKDEKKNCSNFMNRLINLYYENCNGKMNKTRIREILKRDLFWDSTEALSNGIVDEIWNGSQE